MVDEIGGGTEPVRPMGGGTRESIPEAGRGTGALVKSSNGGTTGGRSAVTGLAGICLLAALLTSDRRVSNSRRCCLSYMIEDLTCSMSAAVMSSVTRRLCLAKALCRFCEMPSARRARICS